MNNDFFKKSPLFRKVTNAVLLVSVINMSLEIPTYSTKTVSDSLLCIKVPYIKVISNKVFTLRTKQFEPLADFNSELKLTLLFGPNCMLG